MKLSKENPVYRTPQPLLNRILKQVLKHTDTNKTKN